jgi:hypothetical protein
MRAEAIAGAGSSGIAPVADADPLMNSETKPKLKIRAIHLAQIQAVSVTFPAVSKRKFEVSRVFAVPRSFYIRFAKITVRNLLQTIIAPNPAVQCLSCQWFSRST